jgi:hypothetical protein
VTEVWYILLALNVGIRDLRNNESNVATNNLEDILTICTYITQFLQNFHHTVFLTISMELNERYEANQFI